MPTIEDYFDGEVPEGVVTSCRDCIFAEYAGNEQEGCWFDRIDRFEENGGEVVGLDDDDKRYFAIFGRYCNAHRTQEWGDDHPQSTWMDEVAKEFRLRCSLVIYVDESSTVEQVSASLSSALTQKIVLPWSVVLVLNRTGDPRDFVRMVRDMDPKVPWEVRQITPDEDGSRPTYGHCIDLTVKGLVGRGATFYGAAKAGYMWPAMYLNVINHAINYDMKRIVALRPDDLGNGIMMDVTLHDKLLNGYRVKDLLEKLDEVIEAEGTGHMVSTYEEIRRCVLP